MRIRYICTPPSNKVLRQKLAIQEYNCSIDWIKGELNVVADGLSRLTDEVTNDRRKLVGINEY